MKIAVIVLFQKESREGVNVHAKYAIRDSKINNVDREILR
jgi:hypothetical protein